MENQITSFQKFRLLLWKNFLLEWNQKIALALEIIVPVLFGIIMVLIRISLKPRPVQEHRYPPLQIGTLLYDEHLQNTSRILAYSPKNLFIDNIIENSIQLLSIIDSYKAFENSKELSQAISTTNFTTVIQFDDAFAHLSNYPQKLEFVIRFPSLLRSVPNWERSHPSLSIWHTDRVRDLQPILMSLSEDADGGAVRGYIREGFIQTQHAITMSYIKLAANNAELPQVVMRRAPNPPFLLDIFLLVSMHTISSLLALGYMASTISIARYISQEKEKQLKEVMKIIGVPNWIHWLAWFVRSLLILSLVSVLFVVILKVPVAQNVSVFNYSDWTVLLLFFLVWSISLICFSFMMAVFFDEAATAASVTGLVYFLTLIPIFCVYSAYDDLHLIQKLLLCLNFNFAQAIAIYHICYMEGNKEGAQWKNILKALNEDDSLCLGFIMLMMLISSVLYMIVCLYIEQVHPGEFGVPKKWNFPFKREFWLRRPSQSLSARRKSTAIDRDKPDAFEGDPKNGRVVVEVKGLGKRFGDKWAVENLSLNMFEDEITVLLGHNGAGKTSTISMLTGMTPPTTGTAVINGYDIRTNMDGARASMGICPQRNVLFDDMSVANHLIFFTKLKGIKGRAVAIEVERFLDKIKLRQHANDLPSILSGGMKRKLSLCCALCGDSKVVFCDEPSSGMDPAARRQLWDLLQSEKFGRTILLTTHFMDEADVLADRIAIMSNGNLKCHGTSFFLKKRFGSGHRLICVKTGNSNVEGLTNLLGKYITDIMPESDIGSELTYCLPDRYSSVFGEMLKELEKNMEDLGFSEFGIGVTSLEEVFMKIGAENADPNMMAQSKSSSSSATPPSMESPTSSIYLNAKKQLTESTTDYEPPIIKKTKEIDNFDRKVESKKLSKRERRAREITEKRKNDDNFPKTRDEVPNLTTNEGKKKDQLPKRRFKKREHQIKPIPISSSEEDINQKTEKQNRIRNTRALRQKPDSTRDSIESEEKQNRIRKIRGKGNLLNNENELHQKRGSARDSIESEEKQNRIRKIRGKENLLNNENEFLQKPDSTRDSIESEEKQNRIRKIRGKENLLNNKNENKGRVTFDANSDLAPLMKLESLELQNRTGKKLECDQWVAMFYKNIKYTFRNMIKVLFQNSIGVVFVMFAIVSSHENHFKELPLMTFSLNQYSQSVILLEVISNTNPTGTNIATKYEDYVKSHGSEYKLVTLKDISFENYFLQVGNDNYVDMTKYYIGGATIDKNEITAWFNNRIIHSAPLSLNLVHNAIAKLFIGPDTEIIVKNHPLPFTSESSEKNVFESNAGILLAYCLGFSMAIASAFYTLFIIRENESCYKLVQLISGVPISTFWLTHFIWDFLMLLVVSFRIIVSIIIFQEPGYTTLDELARYSLLLTVFSFSVPPWTYLIARSFKDPVAGFIRASFLFIFTGIALAAIYAPYDSTGIIESDTDSTFYYLFIFLPHFSFTMGWKNLDFNTRRRLQCEDESIISLQRAIKCKLVPFCCEPTPYFSVKSPGILLELLAMSSGGMILLIYLILSDGGCKRCWKCRAPKRYETSFQYEEMDEDVKAERDRVMNMKEIDIAAYHLVIDRMAKFYGYRLVVNYISLSVKGKECFGLLGINGAGKTTTFKMLTGYESISSGDAYVMGISVRSDLSRVYKIIGYCPQYDGLQDELTGRETLFVFCLIRGVQRKNIKALSEGLANSLGFIKHIDKKTKAYSSGNKRKLSTAIAFLGAPDVIFLDEPTSGMDPASQRKAWNMVCLARDSGKLIMLTSHSMGEVEALCTRAAILVNGGIKCIGSIQHLKSKFLKGLVLKVQAERASSPQSWSAAQRLSLGTQSRINEIKRTILNKYPRAVVRSVYQNLLTIYIPLIGIKWSDIFTFLEKNRSRLNIEEYTISQTPLDEIFLDFARQQGME